MKVVIIASLSSSHTVKWANYLNRSGLDILLTFNRQDDALRNQLDSEIGCIEMKIKSPLGYFLNAIELKRIIKENEPDIVHAHFASGYGTLLRYSKAKKSIVSVWGSDIYAFPYESKLKHYLIKRNLNYPKMITSTTHNMVEQVNRLLNRTVENIQVIPFGIDLSVFKYRNQFKTSDEIIIGTVKSLKQVYSIDTLIVSFGKLIQLLIRNGYHSLSEKLKLEIYGTGPELDRLMNLVESLSLNGKVSFKGFISNEDVAKALERFSIFVSTSTAESFGVSIIEAMAVGVPVVATKTLGAIEIIEDGDNGCLVEINDSDAIAEKMMILLTNEEFYDSIHMKARQFVEEKFSMINNVEMMSDLYYKLLKNNYQYY